MGNTFDRRREVIRPAALIAALALAGCASAPEVKVPETVKVPVYVYIQIPEALTEPCVVPVKANSTVGEALRIAKARGLCNEKDTADKAAIRKISNAAVKP